VPLDAYAVGEDGKLGLRGNVISKQGQLMAQSLIAGFARGVSDAFGRVQIPAVMTGSSHQISSNVPYQNSYSEAALQGGAMRGAGSAMDRMANYYMDLSETLFPVIEIDVTRHIEFIVQRGTSLKRVTAKVEENHHLQDRH
jgi:conjugal transfer pilus assembly protein TraB